MTFGPGDRGARAPVAGGGGLRRPAPARAGHPEPRHARAVDRRGADRRDHAHRAHPVARAADGLPAGAAEPGEDLGAHRRLRGRPPHPRRAHGRRRRRHPQRRAGSTASARPARPALDRARPDAPTVAFLGRLDEPRKGLPVLLAAVPAVLRAHPGARFLVAGRGETGPDEVRELLGDDARAVEFLGGITDDEKAALLRSVDVYCAPQTGGESFGIVLVEAMSAGAAVVASDLGAFRRVLDEGTAGTLFRTGDPADLAATLRAGARATTGCASARGRTRPTWSSATTGRTSRTRCSPSTRWCWPAATGTSARTRVAPRIHRPSRAQRPVGARDDLVRGAGARSSVRSSPSCCGRCGSRRPGSTGCTARSPRPSRPWRPSSCGAPPSRSSSPRPACSTR